MMITPGNKVQIILSETVTWTSPWWVLFQKKQQTSFGGPGSSPNNGMYITHKAMKELMGEDNYYYGSVSR